jgi:prophage regulatory protein
VNARQEETVVSSLAWSWVDELRRDAEVEGLSPGEWYSRLRERASRAPPVPGATEGAPRLLSAADVRRRVGVGATTLWRWIRAGAFPRPRYTPGGQRRWAADEVERWETGLRTQPRDVL